MLGARNPRDSRKELKNNLHARKTMCIHRVNPDLPQIPNHPPDIETTGALPPRGTSIYPTFPITPQQELGSPG